jgi:hypothetical protein
MEGDLFEGIVSRQRERNQEINPPETAGAPIRRSRKSSREQ